MNKDIVICDNNWPILIVDIYGINFDMLKTLNDLTLYFSKSQKFSVIIKSNTNQVLTEEQKQQGIAWISIMMPLARKLITKVAVIDVPAYAEFIMSLIPGIAKKVKFFTGDKQALNEAKEWIIS